MDGTIGQQNFDDVEADFYGGIVDQAQIIKSALREAATAFGIHGGSGAGPFFGGAGLDLGKDEAVGVTKDQINLAARGTEIGGEEFEALLFEVFFSGLLTQAAAAQVGGRGFGGQAFF